MTVERRATLARVAARRTESSATPLFLLGLHRGGTTYVQRILNCHRRVVLWGENGGLVTHLRRAHGRAGNLQRAEAARYQEFDTFAARFIPWASRVDQDGLLRAMARFVRDLHRAEPPAAFWGFKEIRHGNRGDLRFLRSLFPEARIALLVRHPRDVLLSQIHVSWSRPTRRANAASRARRFVAQYVRATRAFLELEAEHPGLTRLFRYEELLRRPAVGRLFTWLGLDLDAADRDRLRAVRSARVGSSFSDVGRPLDAGVVDDVSAAFDAQMTSTLKTLDARVTEPLITWYPDLCRRTRPRL